MPNDEENIKATGALGVMQKLREAQGKRHHDQPNIEKYIEASKKSSGKDITIIPSSIAEKQNPPLKNEEDVQPTSALACIYEVNTNDIRRWSQKDRPDNEKEGVEALINSFQQVGQQIPCIVRQLKNKKDKYELIAGECRWMAAKQLNIPLKVVVYELDDRMAALVQAVENEQRSDLSDYAKGMSYAKKIELGILTQGDLVDVLGISKQQVSRLLSFSKIPEVLSKAIGDFRKISARTSEELSRLSSKGEEYIAALIHLAPKIRTGKFGGNRIIKDVMKIVSPESVVVKSKQKVFDEDGRHLFTWRLDNNSEPSIHFPKDIIQLLNNEFISFEAMTTEFKECISKKLLALKN